ncbi:MAG: twin-arginine translocation signal domain-containing protein [Williamsia herbipolensis]|nr:twin-arginine translocation signal domain-containing protein [Williamsia herbipolensis]
MTVPSRRDFLITTGAGAAAAGALVAVPGPADAAAKQPAAPAHAEPLVAHVADPHGSEVRLHSGTRTVVVHDRDLVVRLTRAAAESEG